MLITDTVQSKARRILREMSPEVALDYLNRELGGYGVEYIAHRDDSFTRARGLSYVNTGHTYEPTVIYHHATGRFSWGVSWGDIVESNEGEYI